MPTQNSFDCDNEGSRPSLRDELDLELRQFKADVGNELAELGLSRPAQQAARAAAPQQAVGGISFPVSLLDLPGRPVSVDFPMDSVCRLTSGLAILENKVPGQEFRIQLQHLGWINYAQHHAGVACVRNVSVVNNSMKTLNSPHVEVCIQPDEYAASWRQSLGPLTPGRKWQQTEIRLPLRLDRLRQVRETERASIEVSLWDDGKRLLTEMANIDIQPYNQFVLIEEDKRFLSTFVTPNDGSLPPVLELASRRLASTTGNGSLAGYQDGDPVRVCKMVEAIHEVLREDLKLGYINPPASYDSGQKIRPVCATLEHGRGTCLDLSILLASLIEHIGLHPVIVLVPGHAFLSCWTQQVTLKNHPAPDLIGDASMLSLFNNGLMLPFNSTTLCRPDGEFRIAVQEAVQIIGRELLAAQGGDTRRFVFLIDVMACRNAGVTPLP